MFANTKQSRKEEKIQLNLDKSFKIQTLRMDFVCTDTSINEKQRGKKCIQNDLRIARNKIQEKYCTRHFQFSKYQGRESIKASARIVIKTRGTTCK